MTPPKIPPWSYSSLTSFETCAKRYFHIKVAKDVVEEKHEATTWGTTVHEHLENRALHGTPLPEALSSYEQVLSAVVNIPGELLVEKELAITSGFQPCEWGADDAWCRGIIDIGKLSGKVAVLLDWKTGKRKPASDQLKLFAAMVFCHYPEIDEARTGFIWMKEGKVDKETFRRDQLQSIMMEFAPRVARLHRAYNTASFQPKPSGLCSKWCPVPKSSCPHSGKT